MGKVYAAVLLIGAAVFGYLSWYNAWFGIPLSGDRMTEWLADGQPLERRLRALIELTPDAAAQRQKHLETMLANPVAEVRLRAALLLHKKGNVATESILEQMLHPFHVYSPYTGELTIYVSQGEPVTAARVVATVGGKPVIASTSGTVKMIWESQGLVRTGQRLVEITPSPELQQKARSVLGR